VVVVGNTAPSASEAVGVNCTLRTQSAGASGSGGVVVRPLPLAQVPAGVAAALTSGSGGGGGGGAHLLAAVSVELTWDRGVNGLEPRWQAALVCSVASVPVAGSSAVAIYASPRSVVVDVEVARPRFPFFADVVAELESQRALRSTWSSALVRPVGFAAPDAAPLEGGQVGDAASAAPSPSPQPALHTLGPGALMQAAAAASAPADEASGLQLVAVGAMNVTLVADRRQRLDGSGVTFPRGTAVSVGGAPCRDVTVAASADALRCTLPPTSEVCPHLSPQSSEDCGLQPIVVTAPGLALADVVREALVVGSWGVVDGGGSGGVALAQSAVAALAVNVSCPPFCPGSGGGIVPAPVTPVSLAAPSLRLSRRLAVVGGVYYTARCTAAGFTDPTTGQCGNASSPLSALCAFGAGDRCVACPSWALCPGESLCGSVVGLWGGAMLMRCCWVRRERV
jgi:hypothetical protein